MGEEIALQYDVGQHFNVEQDENNVKEFAIVQVNEEFGMYKYVEYPYTADSYIETDLIDGWLSADFLHGLVEDENVEPDRQISEDTVEDISERLGYR